MHILRILVSLLLVFFCFPRLGIEIGLWYNRNWEGSCYFLGHIEEGEKQGHGGFTLASLLAQLVGKLPASGRPGLDPWLGRSPGEGNGNPLQYSCLEFPWTEEPGGMQSMGSQSWTWLSD